MPVAFLDQIVDKPTALGVEFNLLTVFTFLEDEASTVLSQQEDEVAKGFGSTDAQITWRGELPPVDILEADYFCGPMNPVVRLCVEVIDDDRALCVIVMPSPHDDRLYPHEDLASSVADGNSWGWNKSLRRSHFSRPSIGCWRYCLKYILHYYFIVSSLCSYTIKYLFPLIAT